MKCLFLSLLISSRIEHHIFLSLTYILLKIIKVAHERMDQRKGEGVAVCCCKSVFTL